MKLAKKLMSGLLAFGLVISSVTITTPEKTVAADNKITVNLGVSTLEPASGTKWSQGGTTVYYGTYSGAPTLYRVLKAEGGKLMLDCDSVIYQSGLTKMMALPAKWTNSTIRTELNGDSFYGNTSVFTSVEKNNIVSTNNTARSFYAYQTGVGSTGGRCQDYDSTDYIFLLSAYEAQYLYNTRNDRSKEVDWWTRSNSSTNTQGIYVASDTILRNASGTISYGVSPAFNINESAIAFSVAAGTDRTLFNATGTTSTNAWALSLNDGSGFNASLTGNTNVNAGSSVSVNVTSTASGNANGYTQVSAMLVDGSGNVAAYGKVGNASTGNVNVTIPSAVASGTYTLKVFEESVAGINKTSYVSNIVDAGKVTVANGGSGNNDNSNAGNTDNNNNNSNTGNTGNTDNNNNNSNTGNTDNSNNNSNTGNTGNTDNNNNNSNTGNTNNNNNNSNNTPSVHPDGWETINGKSYWYEGGIKQGTYSDAKGVIGDGTVRGREIYDPTSDGWYWLDACYDGAKAVSKEVWMPYIYQGEENWAFAEIEMNARDSGDMKNQVIQAIQERSGKWVRYDANGKMYKGWYTVKGSDVNLYPSQAGNTYYYDEKTGLMAKGYVAIGGRTYHFDEVTGALIQ